MRQPALTAALLVSISGVAIASDLIPLRPALQGAEVVLYDGQETPFGTVTGAGGSGFCIGRDGAMYHLCSVDGVYSVVRIPRGSLTPELVVSNGYAITGEEFAMFSFVLLPASGPMVLMAQVRETPEDFYRVALVRVDAPDSVTVLFGEGDPAPPPLNGTIQPQPLFRPLNLESDTHFAGRTRVRVGNGPFTGAIIRVSTGGDIQVIEAFPSGSPESVDSTPAFEPDGDVTYLVASPSPRFVRSELRRARPDGAIEVIAASGDPVTFPGATAAAATIRTLICRETVTENIGFDAFRAGANNEIFVTATLNSAANFTTTAAPTALLRIDEDGAHALLLSEQVDPSGATRIAPYLRAFEDGAFVATSGAREEVWFANDEGARVVFDANTQLPGFAPGTTFASPEFATRTVLGAGRYDLARDRVIFRAELDEFPGETNNPTGVFSLASDGTIDLLIRNGDRVVFPDGEREVRYLSTLFENYAVSDDASGQVLVSARFTDGSSAILRLQRAVSIDAASVACAGDLTRDGRVDFSDIQAALTASTIDFADLNVVLSAFGAACE